MLYYTKIANETYSNSYFIKFKHNSYDPRWIVIIFNWFYLRTRAKCFQGIIDTTG